MTTNFWNYLGELVVHNEVVIDRPKGSRHPRYPDVIYPLDYGYLAETTAGDGNGIDVWLGSTGSRSITGIVCTIDRLKRDSEIKVCIGCTASELILIKQFLESSYMGCLLIESPDYAIKDTQS